MTPHDRRGSNQSKLSAFILKRERCWKKNSSSKSEFKDSHLQTDENYLKIVTYYKNMFNDHLKADYIKYLDDNETEI